MNKFRKLDFISYNGHTEVHSSLLNVAFSGLQRANCIVGPQGPN